MELNDRNFTGALGLIDRLRSVDSDYCEVDKLRGDAWYSLDKRGKAIESWHLCLRCKFNAVPCGVTLMNLYNSIPVRAFDFNPVLLFGFSDLAFAVGNATRAEELWTRGKNALSMQKQVPRKLYAHELWPPEALPVGFKDGGRVPPTKRKKMTDHGVPISLT
jgi:hypothetical protein